MSWLLTGYLCMAMKATMKSTGGLTALGLAMRTGKSVVCGHTHRMGSDHITHRVIRGGNS
jgi:hypothetical protein